MAQVTEEKKKKPSVRNGFLKSILIIVAGIAIGYVVRYYSNQNQIPLSLDLPIYAVIALIAGYLIIRIISSLILRITIHTFGVTRGHGAKNFFQILAAIVLIVVIAGLFNFDLAGWLIGAGFIGIVLGLAAQQVLGNLFAGVAILFSRPFLIGDRITLITSGYGLIWPSYSREVQYNGYTGIVGDIGIFYTKMRLDEGVPAVFPNSVVISSLVVNHTKVTERLVRVRMDLDRAIDYGEFKISLLQKFQSNSPDLIIPERSSVEIVDVGQGTYQIVIAVWSRSAYEEPTKTIIIQEAIGIQNLLSQKNKARS